jgi:hypothetical protein
MAISQEAVALIKHNMATTEKAFDVLVANAAYRLREDIDLSEAQKAVGLEPVNAAKKAKKTKKAKK